MQAYFQNINGTRPTTNAILNQSDIRREILYRWELAADFLLSKTTTKITTLYFKNKRIKNLKNTRPRSKLDPLRPYGGKARQPKLTDLGKKLDRASPAESEAKNKNKIRVVTPDFRFEHNENELA